MQIPVILFDLNGLQVYQMETVNTYGDKSLDRQCYYWRDKAAPQGYGPFLSIFSTIEHYKKLIAGWHEGSDRTSVCQLIRVDFANKTIVNKTLTNT